MFGAIDSEVIVCSPFGLKFVVFDLSTSRGVEINNPKFHLTSNVAQGFDFRPKTAHLALLTRASGKDVVSIHHPKTRKIQRSWYPDTIDAQGLSWTPDGQWLLLWESSAHGHKLLLYTPDGELFRSIGPSTLSGGPDADLEPGIKLCRPSPDATLCAVGDHSRSVGILGTKNWRECLRLLHPTTIIPRDTLQVRYLLSRDLVGPSNMGTGLAGASYYLAWESVHSHLHSSNPDDLSTKSIGRWKDFDGE